MDWCWECACLLILAVIGSVNGQAEPQITKEILPTIKRVGETGRLNCTVTRQMDNKVQWIHRASWTIITSDDQVNVEDKFNPIIDGYPKYEVKKYTDGDRSTYILTVRRLQLPDAGIYTCQIHVKGNTDHPSKDGDMVVLIPPTVVQSQTTETMHIQEGEMANLTCNATGYPLPMIKWVRANGQALPDPYNTISHIGTRLELQKLKKQDRGVYRCIADNNVIPTASHDATLYIDFQPIAKPVQTSYGQAQNLQLEIVIECRVAGYPEPDLQWFKITKDGWDPINNDEKHAVYVLISHGQMLSVSEFWYQLKIINVQALDYGLYVCQGENKLGANHTIVELYETSECQGPNCPPERVIFGSAANLCATWTIFAAILSTIFLRQH